MWPALPTRQKCSRFRCCAIPACWIISNWYCRDTLPKRKPDPLPLLHACKHFGVEPGELLLIGDSLNDTQAARAAGSPVFCVPYGYNRGRPVAELDLDAVVPSLLEAAKLISKA